MPQRFRRFGFTAFANARAFGSTYAEDQALSLDVIAERLTAARAPFGRAVFGAFDGEDLVAIKWMRAADQVKPARGRDCSERCVDRRMTRGTFVEMRVLRVSRLSCDDIRT